MPSPMPSMFTTLIEKIDTSPIRVAATSTASEATTPASATSMGMPAARSPPSRKTIARNAIGRAIASPRRRSFSDAVANCSPTRTFPPTSVSGASTSRATSVIWWASSSSASSSRPPVMVTTASAARPSLARSAADPVDHGSTTAITPSIAAIRSSPAPIFVATPGSSTSIPSTMMAISPPVSASSSTRWVTRPDSVLGPAPKLDESTEKAALPMVPAATSTTNQIVMTMRRRRTTSAASEDIMTPSPWRARTLRRCCSAGWRA